MTCPSCGAQNHADFTFCLQCGQSLEQAGQTMEVGGETRADYAPIEPGTMAMLVPEFESQSGLPSGGPSVMSARLRVELGSVDEPFIGLDRPITVIGRRQGNDVVIHDTNVSRRHAQIKRDGNRWTIEDAGSANGTLVNDERIEQSRELNPGDVIRIGDAVFIVELEAGSAPSDAPAPEGSTMAIDLDAPMTSLGGAPDLSSPAMMSLRPADQAMPPDMTAESNFTGLAETVPSEENLSPPPVSAPEQLEPMTSAAPSSPPPAAVPASGPPPSAPAVASPAVASGEGPTSTTLASLRQELSDVGRDLANFSGTLGSLADRVERLEAALDEATSELASVADAIRGPDAAVLKELQGILADIERSADGPKLEDAVQVLEQLSAQPRDIELLLKLSQQASAIEGALQIHGRLVAVAPQLQTTLARLTG